MSRSVCCFCVLLMCGSAAPAWAQAAQVLVRGRVEDENGLAVAAVRVQLQAPDGRTQLASTDAAGRFEVSLPAAGTYRVTLERAGFFRVNARPVELSAERTISPWS